MNIIKKFTRAGRGLKEVLGAEQSIKMELGVSGLVVLAAWQLGVGRSDWLWLLACIMAILVLEGFNTVLERVIDLAEPRYHEMVRQTKDALAGLVLLAAGGAALVGLIVFWPYLG